LENAGDETRRVSRHDLPYWTPASAGEEANVEKAQTAVIYLWLSYTRPSA
jgi:hypothetical protein